MNHGFVTRHDGRLRTLVAFVTVTAIAAGGVAAPLAAPSPVSAAPTTHYVVAGESIQTAVDAAEPGDTVEVAAGTYYENIVMDNPLTLRSADGADVTTIDGGSASDAFAVKVMASGVTVDGFTVKTGESAGGTQKGVWLVGAEGCTITRNTIINNWRGIYVESESLDNTLSHNLLTDNTWSILITGSSGNLITNNTILSGTTGVYLGSGANTCSRNTITVTDYGVWVSSGTCYIDYNTVSSCNVGLYATSSVASYVRGNTVTGCAVGFYAYEIGQMVYWNNFVGNTVQAQINEYRNGWILWYNEQENTGNYWSDYLTRYPDAEEVGETGVYNTPYVIREDSTTLNKDFFPLVNQYVPPAPTWTLSIDANGQGTVEIDAAEATLPYSEDYEDGTDVTLTACAASGWEFVEWTGDATGTNPELTVTMEADISVTAVFAPQRIDIDLAAGWNMVSVPLELDPEANTPGDVFPGAVAVYIWNPGAKSYEVPDSIAPEVGYWVAMTTADTISVTGTPVTEWTDGLTTGWNMCGSVHGASVNVGGLRDDPSGSVLDSAVYWWDPSGKSYSTATQIEQGRGYWVAATQVCDLTVAPSA